MLTSSCVFLSIFQIFIVLKKVVVLLSLILLFIPQILLAQNNLPISVKGYQIYPDKNWRINLTSSLNKNQSNQYIIQFLTLPTELEQAAFKKVGIKLLDYVPSRAFVAIIPKSAFTYLEQHSNVQQIVILEPSMKLDYSLQNNQFLNKNRQQFILLSFYKNEISIKELTTWLTDLGAENINLKFSNFGNIEFQISESKLEILAQHHAVRYISKAFQPELLNEDVRSSIGANLWQPNFIDSLTGKGIVIGVGDNCAPIYHIDIKDRTINFNPWSEAEHGSHVSGTIGGKGILNPKARGIVPDAHFLGHLFDLGWSQTEYLKKYYNMTLTNNSYASVVNDCSYSGLYDQYASMLDEISVEEPEVLHVFAAGNDGLLTCNGYTQGFQTVPGGYQPAKNIITVGGIQKNNTLAAKSSRGPVKDGRLKPEIVSIGWGVLSCTNNNQYAAINGTSMAAPSVTGAAAMLSQRFKSLYNGQNPRADLLKALLLNGATDMGNQGPDYKFGFGQLNVDRSLKQLQNGQFFTSSITNGQTKTQSITVPTGVSQLKVMLYYHDTAASPMSSIALVNDLNLTVNNTSNVSKFPLKLNPSSSNVNDIAIEGIDNLNNVEQVVWNNPSSGTYSINVKGDQVVSSNQNYVVVYDFIYSGIKISSPAQDIPIAANDTTRIFWEATDDLQLPFQIELSLNAGNTWSTIASNINYSERVFFWQTPNIASSQAMIRISRGSQQATSGKFTIVGQPKVELNNDQCIGYFGINWGSISGATSYEIMRKKGDDFVSVAIVNDTNYILSGLALDSTYYVSVRAMINGKPGVRSIAVFRAPNTGNCVSGISDGDLAIAKIDIFKQGRDFTSLSFSNNEKLYFNLWNLGFYVSSFKLSYQINNGSWQSQLINSPLSSKSAVMLEIDGFDFSTIGNYTVKAAIENLQSLDLVSTNDTAIIKFQHLPNEPIDLSVGFLDDFELWQNQTITKSGFGISGTTHWDYQDNMGNGRLRTYVSDDVLISGQKSLSLDAAMNVGDQRNFLLGTFNLQNYSVDTNEVRLELKYKFHGQPKFLEGNEIFVRGSDLSPWLSLCVFDTSRHAGELVSTGSLSLSHLLQQNGQNFSSSFQVMISQRDTSVIAMNEYGNGLTIDDFKLYTVKNDLQLSRIIAPVISTCGDGNNVDVTIQLYNSDNLPQKNISVFYQFDNGNIFAEMLDSIGPKQTIQFTFQQKIASFDYGSHALSAWISVFGDTYLLNDSLMKQQLFVQPLINQFPYIEHFEGNHFWFAQGKNSSWEIGQPHSSKWQNVPSGNKAWVTNLSGNYNNNERSFLYSPCFDWQGLNNPHISFSVAMDIEDCGNQICDYAFVEYSQDGVNWNRLGSKDSGFNWYQKDYGFTGKDMRWHVASCPLPKLNSSARFRFVFVSDQGTSKEGIAIDDIHIYDTSYGISSQHESMVSLSSNLGNWKNFISENQIVGSVNQKSGSEQSITLSHFIHNQTFNPVAHQYFLPRSFILNANQPIQASDSFQLRLFVLDDEVVEMIDDQTCVSCEKAKDVYSLGFVHYNDSDFSLVNNKWSDNKIENVSFIADSNIEWVPYLNGYYAHFLCKEIGEYWLTHQKPKTLIASGFVYPNPIINNTFNFIWTTNKIGEVLFFKVIDLVGRKIVENKMVASNSENQTLITLPNVSSGMYLLHYEINGISNYVKLVVP